MYNIYFVIQIIMQKNFVCNYNNLHFFVNSISNTKNPKKYLRFFIKIFNLNKIIKTLLHII